MTISEITFTTENVYLNIAHPETGLVDTMETTAEKAKSDYGTLRVKFFSESGERTDITAEAEG